MKNKITTLLLTLLSVLTATVSGFGQGIVEPRNITYTGSNTFNNTVTLSTNKTMLGVTNLQTIIDTKYPTSNPSNYTTIPEIVASGFESNSISINAGTNMVFTNVGTTNTLHAMAVGGIFNLTSIDRIAITNNWELQTFTGGVWSNVATFVK